MTIILLTINNRYFPTHATVISQAMMSTPIGLYNYVTVNFA